MRSCDFRKLVAVALVLTTIFITMPVSAADLSKPKPVLGSISAVGSVELRGLAITQEGTLFAGDRIRANEKGYAKILLTNGSKIELAEKTDVSIDPESQGVKIAMNAGNVGFTAHTPVRIALQPFEILAMDDSAGSVAVMGPKAAGVRSINGKVTVRNTKTSESFILTKGQERLLGLSDGSNHKSLGEIASNVPGPIPTPQAPAGRTGGRGLSMDAPAWIAVIAGAAVGAVAIAGLVIAQNNKDDINNLRSENSTLRSSLATAQNQFTSLQASITGLQTSLNTANTNIAGLRADLRTTQTAISGLQTLQQIQSNTAALQSAIQEAISAVQSSTTLTAAQKTQLLANLQVQLSAARNTQGRVASLAAGSAAEIAAAVPEITTLGTTANTQVTAATEEITRVATNPAVVAAGVIVPTPPQLPAITPPRVASASIPE